MGSSASLVGAGAIEGDFKHYSGSTIALNHTNEARFGDDKTLIQWVNPYTLLLFPEDDYEVQLFVYNGIKDALVCVVSKFGKRAMLQAYEESELYTRVKGMFESAPKVPMSKQVSGHFRGLFVHDIKTSDPIIHGEPAKVQWLNPCCFRTEKGGKRAPELWVYHKAADTFLQVVVCDNPVADARSDPRRKHKRLTAAEIAEVEKNGMGKEDEGIDLLATAAGAADEAPETAAMSKTVEPVIKARQVSPVEEPGADGKFTVVIEGRFSGTDGDEIRVKSNSIKKGGQKAKIDWISPYAFSYAPDGDDESQHLFIYSFDYNGFYEVTQAADSVALTYGGTHFYTRTEGEAPLELMMIERQWGPFERLHIPEEEGQPLILEGVEYKFDWLNPFSFHINVDGQDQIFTYCVEQTAFLQLGAWEQPVWSARSKFEHMMQKLDPTQAPVPVVKRQPDADDGEGEDEDGEDDDEEDEEEEG